MGVTRLGWKGGVGKSGAGEEEGGGQKVGRRQEEVEEGGEKE